MDELRARLRTQFLDLFDTLPPDIAERAADSIAKAALAEIGETHVLIQKHDARIQWADTLVLRDEEVSNDG